MCDKLNDGYELKNTSGKTTSIPVAEEKSLEPLKPLLLKQGGCMSSSYQVFFPSFVHAHYTIDYSLNITQLLNCYIAARI